MERREFIKGLAATTAMGSVTGLSTLQTLADAPARSDRMPALFVGHGSPMNAIEENRFSKKWQELGRTLPRPEAILVVSAHWLTKGTKVTAMEKPRTIHDFGGFPQALFDQQYPAPGSPAIAKATQEAVLPQNHVTFDEEWGFDHGSWSVLTQMYPSADIPTLQLSIDYNMSPDKHFELGQQIAALRDKGVLIMGSGNIVHNLRALTFDGKSYDWAQEFDAKVGGMIASGDRKAVLEFQKWGSIAKMSHPTYEHFLPLFYILGAAGEKDTPSFFNEGIDLGSISMRSVIYS